MAFSGYPDGNRIGSAVAASWELAGDLIRDMPALLAAHGLEASDEPLGAAGSVHLWRATRPAGAAGAPKRPAPGSP